MKFKSSVGAQVLVVCAVLALVATTALAQTSLLVQPMIKATLSQEAKPQEPGPKISKGESEFLQKIQTAPDPAAKLQLAAEFLKKHSKTVMRPNVARHIVGVIAEVPDPAQKITLAQNFTTVFKDPSDAELVNPILLEAYIKTNRFDDAFALAAAVVAKNPEDVATMAQMSMIGIDQAKQNNPKFVQVSQQYAVKAIELIETDKKPAGMEAEQWKAFKNSWLPSLYQSVGLISMMTRNTAAAKENLEKARALKSDDPFTFILLGSISNDEYQDMAQKFKSLSGPAATAEMKKIEAKLDEIINLYAQAIALIEGKTQYQALRDQVMQDLQAYYKFRNKNSTDGLQQLIDKYKKPATP